MGGAVEEITGFFGPGLTGRRLIDGLPGPAWAVPIDWNPNAMYDERSWVKYPEDIVFSFFERMPALVGAVGLVLPESKTLQVEDETTGPREVEIWTAMDAAPERISQGSFGSPRSEGRRADRRVPCNRRPLHQGACEIRGVTPRPRTLRDSCVRSFAGRLRTAVHPSTRRQAVEGQPARSGTAWPGLAATVIEGLDRRQLLWLPRARAGAHGPGGGGKAGVPRESAGDALARQPHSRKPVARRNVSWKP